MSDVRCEFCGGEKKSSQDKLDEKTANLLEKYQAALVAAPDPALGPPTPTAEDIILGDCPFCGETESVDAEEGSRCEGHGNYVYVTLIRCSCGCSLEAKDGEDLLALKKRWNRNGYFQSLQNREASRRYHGRDVY